MPLDIKEEVAKALAQEEIQSELTRLRSPAPTRLRKFKDFLNSQFGGWLLGTVLVGLFTFGWSYGQPYLPWEKERRKANENAAILEKNAAREEKLRLQSREDSEFLVKILPMMSSSDNLALSCQSTWALLFRHPEFEKDPTCQRNSDGKDLEPSEKGLCLRLSYLVKITMRDRYAAALHPDQTPGEGAASKAAVKTAEVIDSCTELLGIWVDKLQVESGGDSKNPPPVSFPALKPDSQTEGPNTRLVVIYIQIFDESDRAAAIKLQEELKKEGFVAPGVENVSGKATKLDRSIIRWYPNGDDRNPRNPDLLAAQTIQSKAFVVTKSAFIVQSNSAKVKPGTIEVWFGSHTSTQ